MEKIITRKVVEAEVKLTLSAGETIALANALNRLFDFMRGGVSPTTERMRHEFNELSKELNPI